MRKQRNSSRRRFSISALRESVRGRVGSAVANFITIAVKFSMTFRCRMWLRGTMSNWWRDVAGVDIVVAMVVVGSLLGFLDGFFWDRRMRRRGVELVAVAIFIGISKGPDQNLEGFRFTCIMYV